MNNRIFIPSEDVAVVLNALLDAYERRKLSSSSGSGVEGGMRLIKYALGEQTLPNYFSQIDPGPRKIVNEQLQILAQKGWLRLTWQPRESGHLLAQVAMPPDCAAPIFDLVGRMPLAEKRGQLTDLILGERFRFQSGWRQRAIGYILAQIRAEKSPGPFSLTDHAFNEDLLTALAALDTITTETPYRVFSVRVFNDSKRFEDLKNAIVRLARRGQAEWRELSPQDVLRELNLVPNPGYIYLSGSWELVDELGQVISLGEFSPSVGIPAAQAATLRRVTAHASQVICVENPTSFHELIRTTQSATGIKNASIATICLWGNPSPACRHLLSQLADTLPENTPLHVWADMDYGGFNILAILRKYVSTRFEPYLMDVETLESHALWARPLTRSDQRNLKRLAQHPALKDIKAVIAHMLQRNLKLEQEAITPTLIP